MIIFPKLIRNLIALAVLAVFSQMAIAQQVKSGSYLAVAQRLDTEKALRSPVSVIRVYGMAPGALWTPARLQSLLEAIENSQSHGLEPRDYHLSVLTSATRTADIEVFATDAYLTLAGHLLGGRVDPVSLEPTWNAKGRSRDLPAYLLETLADASATPAQSLEKLAPSQPRYARLREALAHYNGVLQRGGWPKVNGSGLLKPGQTAAWVPALRARLIASGDYPSELREDAYYDAELVHAVKGFQLRSNLEPDGIVGPVTLRKLNLSVHDRVSQIKVNLERWRWLPEDMGYRHIRVNIADYRLEVHEGPDVTEIFDVVVGRTYRQTPIFSGSMSYLVLNPWWEVPSKLARQDLLPKFQKDPEIIREMGYHIIDAHGQRVDPYSVDWNALTPARFPYRVRQEPGEKNALGRVKFMFPNQHAVYLHDTPSRDLFGKVRRDFSSGCIRVNDPLDLAAWVLRGTPQWSEARLMEVAGSGRETVVNMKDRIPVHLLYWTVVVNDETGDVRFIEDIYERDARVWAAIQNR